MGLGRMVTLVKLLQIADFLTSVVQLLHDGFQGDVLVHHHHRQVVDEVRDLPHGVRLDPVLGGDNGLAALLPHLLEDLVQALVQPLAGVGALLGVVPPVLHHSVKALECLVHVFTPP